VCRSRVRTHFLLALSCMTLLRVVLLLDFVRPIFMCEDEYLSNIVFYVGLVHTPLNSGSFSRL
jgi:hypothetical protein